LRIFPLASRRKKKQFDASQTREKAMKTKSFSAVFRYRWRA
jgi:hypothetical protein